MESNRRSWLKQLGLGIASIGLTQLESVAAPFEKHRILDDSLLNFPVRLNANENPFGPGPKAREALIKNAVVSNRYNLPQAKTLVEKIAEAQSVAAENVLLGAGSTEILDVTGRYAALSKGSLVLGDPTFGFWTETAERLGLKRIKVPLTADKKLDLPAMLKAMTPDTKLVYLCNPNNPTGTLNTRADLEAFITEASKTALVLIDEAYIEFTNEKSFVGWINSNKNIIVAKTFSKVYGMAGARLGYAIAHKDTIKALSGVQSWPNGNNSIATVAAGLAALTDPTFVKDYVALNEKARTFTYNSLTSMGLKVIPSYTNFLYFSLEGYKKDYYKVLEQNKIMGREIFEQNGKWTRISIGTMAEMEYYVKALG